MSRTGARRTCTARAGGAGRGLPRHWAPRPRHEHRVHRHALLRLGKLGSFDFNTRYYADDDLIVGAVNPFELFRIMVEVVRGGGLGVAAGRRGRRGVHARPVPQHRGVSFLQLAELQLRLILLGTVRQCLLLCASRSSPASLGRGRGTPCPHRRDAAAPSGNGELRCVCPTLHGSERIGSPGRGGLRPLRQLAHRLSLPCLAASLWLSRRLPGAAWRCAGRSTGRRSSRRKGIDIPVGFRGHERALRSDPAGTRMRNQNRGVARWRATLCGRAR